MRGKRPDKPVAPCTLAYRVLCSLAYHARFALFALVLGLPASAALAAGTAAVAGTSGGFDHAGTGFPLTGAHIVVRCEACHIGGQFRGTRQCAVCHSPGARVAAVYRPATHLPTFQTCDTCHSTTTFAPQHFSHVDVVAGTCATCHNGYNVAGKPATHIPVLAATACDACHFSVVAFSGTPMNHAVVTAIACSTCHEAGKSFSGVTIVTRPGVAEDPSHPPVGECSSCHANTISFVAGITTYPANHIPTGALCAQCHASANFAITISNAAIHIGIATGCTACHAPSSAARAFLGVSPRAEVAGHIPTVSSCELCHAGALPAAVSFAGGVMNHAGITSGCDTCHEGGLSFFGVTMVTRATAAAKFPAHPTGGDCSDCHHSTVSFVFGAPATFVARVAAARASTGALRPNLPRTGLAPPASAASIGAAGWAGNSAATAHAGVLPGSCAQCHGAGGAARAAGPAGSAASGAARAKPAGHVLATLSCDACHRTTAWLPATFSHDTVAGACDACHNGRNASAKPPSHMITTRACDTCHRGTATWSAVRYNHLSAATSLQAGSLPCITCHRANTEAAMPLLRGTVKASGGIVPRR